MSECRSIVYNLLISTFQWSVRGVCREKFLSEVSFCLICGMKMSCVCSQDGVYTCIQQIHYTYNTYTIHFDCPGYIRCSGKSWFQHKKTPQRNHSSLCASFSGWSNIHWSVSQSVGCVTYVSLPLVSVHSRGGLYYSDQCTQSDAAFNISHRIIQAAKR